MASSSSSSYSLNLPAEIITEILSYLPVPSLLRFQSVSKSFYTLIKSHLFINLHLTNHLTNHLHVIISTSTSTLLSSTLTTNLLFSELNHPLKPIQTTQNTLNYFQEPPGVTLLGHSYGVLSISNLLKTRVFLFSPGTRTRHLVQGSSHLMYPQSYVLFGFGFDPTSNDFKLLRIVQCRESYCHVKFYNEAKVYSLRDGLWKWVDEMDSFLVYKDCHAVFVHKAFHFVVCDATQVNFIGRFHIVLAKWSLMELPAFPDQSQVSKLVLKELGGCLCLMVNYTSGFCVDLWVLKEYMRKDSWVRVLSLEVRPRFSEVRPVVYSNDGKRVLLLIDNCEFQWCSLMLGGDKRVKVVRGKALFDEPFDAGVYGDSVVSLDDWRIDSPAKHKKNFAAKLWFCNFTSQLATSLIVEGDYHNSLGALMQGYNVAAAICYLEMQMYFATSILHVHVMQWDDVNMVEQALRKCDEVWEAFDLNKREQCPGLLFYNELLHVFYRFRICDYKNVAQHIDKLDAAMKSDMQRTEQIQELTIEINALNQTISHPDVSYRNSSTMVEKRAQLEQQLRNLTTSSSFAVNYPDSADLGFVRKPCADKLEFAPYPIDGEWLPKSAVYALVDLTVVIFGRPKGLFKECGKRIQSGIQAIQVELSKLGITNGVREVDLQHSAIWMASVYLMLLMQFLENKIAVDLTRAEFVEAQEALVQMRNWYIRFPTILQACESIIEMLRGQYAHSAGCFSEAAYHFLEAAKLTENNSIQAMCQVYGALSYICAGDAESSSLALDLIGPVFGAMDSFIGVREKTTVLFAYGLLSMKQQNLQDARIRLATGLQLTHSTLGNLQLVSQYLTVLGSLALALHDTMQAREILRSSLTLAKKLNDVPTQIWVLSVLTALYKELGEKGHEMENSDYHRKKVDDLQIRLGHAYASIHHIELIKKDKIQVQQLHESDSKRGMENLSMKVNLDIPESVGLAETTPPVSSSRRLDLDSKRRGKRKL